MKNVLYDLFRNGLAIHAPVTKESNDNLIATGESRPSILRQIADEPQGDYSTWLRAENIRLLINARNNQETITNLWLLLSHIEMTSCSVFVKELPDKTKVLITIDTFKGANDDFSSTLIKISAHIPNYFNNAGQASVKFTKDKEITLDSIEIRANLENSGIGSLLFEQIIAVYEGLGMKWAPFKYTLEKGTNVKLVVHFFKKYFKFVKIQKGCLMVGKRY